LLQNFYPIVREQYEIPGSNCFVDFYAYEPKKDIHHFVEVKNEQVRIKHMEQIMKYFVHMVERYGWLHFRFTVIASTIYDKRLEILSKLGIQIITLRTLKDLEEQGLL